MREYKFRGKRVDNGEWVYGNFFIWTRHSNKLVIIGEGVQNGSINGHEVIPETVGQFTGLHDKNGREIYEGDIIKFKDTKPLVVEWDDKFAQFVMKPSSSVTFYVAGDIEIIGNIYENPEALKEGGGR